MEFVRIIPWHNLMRWFVLLSACWAVLRPWHGLIQNRSWNRGDKLAGLMFTTIANVQFVLGLFVFVTSPNVRILFSDFSYPFSSRFAFFLTLYHPVMMFVAVGIAQGAYSLSKRSTDDARKFSWAAWGYLLAILMMIAAIPWPFYSFGRPFFRSFGGLVFEIHTVL